ncbi:MAG TPA: hypothetical protein VMG12_27625 [Polyangiaceae bacterium]|nr:hypothetical protein [Polyangiaceae bacterium]
MSSPVKGWTAFGLLLVSAVAVGGAQNPAPTPLIRSVEVFRPDPVDIAVIPSEPRGPSLAAEPPLVCESATPQALLRPGCPEAPPDVRPCSEEGLECRYATEADCVARYECVYGLWTSLELSCSDASRGQLLSGSGSCEANTPVADSPCADEGSSCGHLACGIGGIYQVVAACRCGRWYLEQQQCPLTR